jgi:hypothetical protein
MNDAMNDRSRETQLARMTDHLAEHRRMIVLRSLAAGLAGMTPVPLVDDWLVSVIKRGTLQRIAEARQVDISPEALRAVADGASAPPTWKTLASASLLPLLMKRTLRKAMVLLAAARRADDVLASFAVATLFDHYCARLHVGAELDLASGRALRADMDAVLGRARTHVIARLFRRALGTLGRAALRAPVELADIATAGLLTRFLRARRAEDEVHEAEAVELVEGAVARAGDERGFLGKVAAAVDAGVSTVGQEYVKHIVAAFEARLEQAAES